jgi:hypothetical protein
VCSSDLSLVLNHGEGAEVLLFDMAA